MALKSIISQIFLKQNKSVMPLGKRSCQQSRFSVNRSVCQIWQNCIRAEKNSAKTTFNRTWTLDPKTDCAAHFLSLMPYHCARFYVLKDWDFNDLYVVMLYWFQLNPLSSSKSKNQ